MATGGGGFCTFLQGKDTLLCLCSSRQPGELMVIEWTSVEWSALRVQAKKKKNVGQRACTCVRATAGQRAAASNYDFLSSGTKRLQLHFREGRRVFFFSCHSLAEVVKYNLILLPLSLFFLFL